MKLVRQILVEIGICTFAGFLFFLIVGAVGSFLIWGNMFANDDTMLGFRLFTGAGFGVGVVRVGILLKYGKFK